MGFERGPERRFANRSCRGGLVGRAAGLLGLVLLAALASRSVMALPPVSLTIGDIEGKGWQAAGVQLKAVLGAGAEVGAVLTVQELRVAQVPGEWRDLRLECPQASLAQERLACPAGVLTGRHSLLGHQRLSVALEYGPAATRIEFAGLSIAGGRIRGVAADEGDWRVRAEAEDVDLASLPALVVKRWLPEGFTLTGTVDGELLVSDAAGPSPSGELEMDWQAGGFASPDGMQAGEGLQGQLRMAFARSAADWQADVTASMEAGQAYIDPFFVDFSQQPIQAQGEVSVGPDGNRWQVADVRLEQEGVGQLQGSGRLALAEDQPLRELRARLDGGDAAGLYRNYVSPLVIGTVLDNLEVVGGISGELHWASGAARRVEVDLDKVYADDRDGRFGVYDLSGQLRWDEEGASGSSRIHLAGGHLYDLRLGEAEVPLTAVGERVSLDRPVRIPVMDGALALDSFSLTEAFSSDRQWKLSGALEPVSMESLTHALGWPLMSGTLAGQIPEVRYREGELRMDGHLRVQAFDGEIRIGDLELRRPLGTVPELRADVSMTDLDLATLTRTFSFGRIEGRLEGAIRDLVLLDWEPTRFSAVFRTPPDDNSRHRISQRAVNNLTRLGSGPAGALSTGFLRFFEDFAYDRIRLECDLEGRVAEMDGIDHPGGGYYIVKGAGLPRIDVIAYTRRVAWADLVERLKRIRVEGGPVIQ